MTQRRQPPYETAKRPIVRARITALMDIMESEALHDAVRANAFIVERLWAEASDMSNRASERLRAIELLGKLSHVGSFVERSEVVTPDLRTSDEIKQRINELLRL